MNAAEKILQQIEGMEHWHTGGNCTMYRFPLSGGYYIGMTSVRNECQRPERAGEACMLGVYGADLNGYVIGQQGETISIFCGKPVTPRMFAQNYKGICALLYKRLADNNFTEI